MFRRFATKGFLGFKSPKDLINSARKSIAVSEELQSLLLECNDASKALRYTDDISNALCLVTDAASAIRNVNIGGDWDQASAIAMNSVEEHMRSLNANARIYEKLVSFSKRGLLSETEENVLSSFLHDFEDALVHLPLQQRLCIMNLLQKECVAAENYLEADRHANSQQLSLPSSFPPNNLASRLFPSSSPRSISSNYTDVMAALQNTDCAASRSQVRGGVSLSV